MLNIWGVATVYFHVRPQRAWIRAVKLTLVAFVRLFSSVYFQMCALSNVSSNGLPEKRQSHTGCIYLTFLRCVLLNVSSDGLLERKLSCTGCICLTFLHCVISYETSKNLDQSSQTHIGWLFLDVSFQMWPQIVFLGPSLARQSLNSVEYASLYLIHIIHLIPMLLLPICIVVLKVKVFH